jgi:oligoendopeptidase F
MTMSLLLISLLAADPAMAADADVTWDLSAIYADDAAWEAAKVDLAGQVNALDVYRGRLDTKGTVLAEALEHYFELDKALSRLYGYASMRGDEDVSAPGPQGMQQSVRGLWSDFEAAGAWLDPEILAIPEKKLAKFRSGTPELAPYGRYIERLEARRPHVLDAESERLLGMTGRLKGVGGTISGMLRGAEIPWTTITLPDETELRVDPVGYSMGRSHSDREVRAATYTAFYTQLDAFEGSLAASLSATVQEHVFEAKVRGYGSALEASLGRNEVDPAVYDMLVTEIGEGLPVLHRYLKLRARLLGVDTLGYHDMYPSLTASVSESYDWPRSQVLVAEALLVLGDEYVATLNRAAAERWVDVLPRENKRSGAYVTDASYDVHPYMLLNHLPNYLGLSTYAHEGGHLVHSAWTQAAQPYPTSNYATFVAEVASTVNEVLLFEHLVAKAPDDDARLALLGHFLEGLRTTVFRQTMFAEFERDVHAAVEAGDPLSPDRLDKMYGDLLRRYHGEAEGVMVIDPLVEAEWSYIPHFHYDFYVYQYATSYVAAIALAKGILSGEEGAVERYHAFLKSGSTKPPVELLRDAGVDMASPKPMRAAVAYMDEVITRIEVLVAE